MKTQEYITADEYVKDMSLIGKGAFTKCYQKDKKTVRLISSCPIKESMSMGWFPESYLFPSLERLDSFDEGAVYDMPYFPKVKSLKSNLSPRQWELYTLLRNLPYFSGRSLHNLSSHWHKAFDTLPSKFAKEREALKEALDACGNYGSDISFEISPRNVAVKGKKLVLLDCFFSASKLRQVRS